MVTYVTMPKLGLTMKEGIVVKWLKKEGEPVEKGEAILEIETEKIYTTVEAPASGMLYKRVAPEGAVVPVAGLVAVIAKPGEEVPPIEEVIAKAEIPPTVPVTEKAEEIEKPPAVPVPKERIKISPLAKKIAKEHKIDVTKIKGTGPGGRIVKKDVLEAIEKARATPAPVAPSAVEPVKVAEVIPMTGVRKTIAERLSQSYRSAVHATVMTEVDMTESVKLRQRLLPEIKKKTGASLTYTAMIVKAVAIALGDYPLLNSTLDGDQIQIIEDINVGVGVAIEGGLIVPVVRNADKKSLTEIAQCLEELIEKARKRLLSLEEVTGGTFTITNLGMFGVHTFVPIINPPETAILGVGTIDEKPIVINEKIEIRSRMNLSLVFDHRVLDGAEAARFLQTLEKNLENPSTLLE